MSAAGRAKPVRSSSAPSRRSFLRGAAGAGLAWPLWDALLPGRRANAAAAAESPKRLVILFSPNGTNQADFFGPGDTTTLTLGPILQPLASHKDDLLVLDGLDSPAASASQGDPHGAGIGCLLTGKTLQSGNLFASSSGGPGSGWADNISIDQLIAQNLAAPSLRSLELAGKRCAGNLWSRMSYRGPADPVTPEDDPQRAWDLLFAEARRSAHRKKILDNVRKELTALGAKLSGDDAQRLRVHLDTVTSLQTHVGGTSTTQVKAPPRPTVTPTTTVVASASGQQEANAANDVDFPKILRAELDLVVGALASDLTRVASVIMAPSASNIVPSWLTFNGAPIAEGHCDLSHASESDSAAQMKLTLINAWYAQQIADFITKLKAIPEGVGTLFDSTLIVWLNELGSGSAHSHTRLPVLLAGSAGRYFKTGRYVKYPSGTSINDLLVSVANAMGVRPTATDASSRPYVNRFGDPTMCKGPLPGLTG